MNQLLKEEIILKILEVKEKIQSSNLNSLEILMMTHHELNPLILAYGEILLKEENIL